MKSYTVSDAPMNEKSVQWTGSTQQAEVIKDSAYLTGVSLDGFGELTEELSSSEAIFFRVPNHLGQMMPVKVGQYFTPEFG